MCRKRRRGLVIGPLPARRDEPPPPFQRHVCLHSQLKEPVLKTVPSLIQSRSACLCCVHSRRDFPSYHCWRTGHKQRRWSVCARLANFLRLALQDSALGGRRKVRTYPPNDCAVCRISDHHLGGLDLAKRPPPLGAIPRDRGFGHGNCTRHSGRSNRSVLSAASHLFGPRRFGANVLLHCRRHRCVHWSQVGGGKPSAGVRLGPTSSHDVDLVVDLCALRPTDCGCYIPSSWDELVAACFERTRRGDHPHLDSYSCAFPARKNRSRSPSSHHHVVIANRPTLPRICSFHDSRRLGSRCSPTRVANGDLDGYSRSRGSTALGHDRCSRNPSVAAHSGGSRTTTFQRRWKAGSRMSTALSRRSY